MESNGAGRGGLGIEVKIQGFSLISGGLQSVLLLKNIINSSVYQFKFRASYLTIIIKSLKWI